MKVALSLVIVASLLAAGAESTSVKKQPHHRQIAVNNFGPPARVGLSKLAPPVSTVVNSGPVQTIKGYSLLSKPVATTPAGVSRNLLGGVSNLVSSLLGGDKPAPSASPSHSRKPSSTPLPPAPYETPSKGY